MAIVVKSERWLGFLRWLKSRRVPKAKLVLADFADSGRGLMATRDIEAGEAIVDIPESVLITRSVFLDSLAREGIRADQEWPLSEHQALTLFLVSQRLFPEAKWAPYVAMLPTEFDSVASQLPEELARLLPSDLQDKIKEQRHKLKQDWTAGWDFLKNIDRASEYASMDERLFEWAWLAVSTRCITLESTKNKTMDCTIALAPMLDFLNHSLEAQVETGFDPTTRSFKITTRRPYRRGTEVFISYGPHDNSFLLAEYGFILKNNPYNHICVDREFDNIALPGERPDFRSNVLRILEQEGLKGDYTLHASEASYRLMMALRLRVSTTARDFKDVLRRWYQVQRGERSTVSPENEAAAHETLLQIIDRLEDHYRLNVDECRAIAAARLERAAFDYGSWCVEELLGEHLEMLLALRNTISARG
ncbi:uncharacterized protein BJ171DRAFT_497154 [Polychytrium aggregatum]|uniref:uncharacterized protein n=1 Tax=Polychytrium aggregatum TaxID=110093 RepID=UPI0022FF370A|nr:uncharacterized protein BJ171DRAFT_497154 [Polychytrium aggregatum]KAI9206274.1 hypothetical protein BJ171DRAFT_497154 [Polychytrium aggregatum]